MQAFSSKIILFGEYALLKGAMGLAIPFPKFAGKLAKPVIPDITPEQQESNAVIVKIAEWIARHSFHYSCHIEKLKQDIARGIYFESNIPQGYGLGSSGALVAALYANYFQIPEKPGLTFVKTDLSQLESFFHGKSSGTDPLVSFINQPICLNARLNTTEFRLPENLHVFLIDSGKPSHTKGLVTSFLQKSGNEPQRLSAFMTLNDQCVQMLLQPSGEVFQIIRQFCQFEQQFLPAMFPNKTLLNGIAKDLRPYVGVKLCGSGGGGFLLGFAQGISYLEIERYFTQKSISTLEISHSVIDNKKLVFI